MLVTKVIEDGRVAVLISPGFGAGWSTWAEHDIHERVLFDPFVVEWVRNGKQGPVPVDHYNEYFYDGGAEDLVIKWLPVGTKFIVREYDGHEFIETEDEIKWSIA